MIIKLASSLFEQHSSKIAGTENFAKKNILKGTDLGTGLELKRFTGNPDIDYHRSNICTFTNHSLNPNLIVKRNKNKYNFITKKDIKQNEELTVNYHLFDFEGKRDFK